MLTRPNHSRLLHSVTLIKSCKHETHSLCAWYQMSYAHVDEFERCCVPDASVVLSWRPKLLQPRHDYVRTSGQYSNVVQQKALYTRLAAPRSPHSARRGEATSAYRKTQALRFNTAADS